MSLELEARRAARGAAALALAALALACLAAAPGAARAKYASDVAVGGFNLEGDGATGAPRVTAPTVYASQATLTYDPNLPGSATLTNGGAENGQPAATATYYYVGDAVQVTVASWVPKVSDVVEVDGNKTTTTSYTFLGWTTSKEADRTYSGGETVSLSAGANTLYAKYYESTTVIVDNTDDLFDDDDSEADNSEDITVDEDEGAGNGEVGGAGTVSAEVGDALGSGTTDAQPAGGQDGATTAEGGGPDAGTTGGDQTATDDTSGGDPAGGSAGDQGSGTGTSGSDPSDSDSSGDDQAAVLKDDDSGEQPGGDPDDGSGPDGDDGTP
jgi:hypothetical protein